MSILVRRNREPKISRDLTRQNLFPKINAKYLVLNRKFYIHHAPHILGILKKLLVFKTYSRDFENYGLISKHILGIFKSAEPSHL